MKTDASRQFVNFGFELGLATCTRIGRNLFVLRSNIDI